MDMEPEKSASKSRSQAVDILVVGAGWTSTFLIPICEARGLTHAATSRSGRNGTIRFEFNQELGLGSGGGSTGGEGNHEAENGGGNQGEAAASGVGDVHRDDEEGFARLPQAQTVLITFPITKPGAVARLVRTYMRLHVPEGSSAQFIQLGATSIWDNLHRWCDRRSPYTRTDRAASEDELLAIGNGTVLNLAGLWGGKRDTRNWVGKVAPTKEALRNKGSIHMIHGHDVARAILAVHANFDKAAGQRWILSDGRVYDWWDLASAWGVRDSPSGDRGPHPLWVLELMQEAGVRGLPRDVSLLGRALDSRDFWVTFGLTPEKARLDSGDV
ncbi:hypothetical protein PC9H_009320 [Pleurotus ostreatus]|uniref:Uncharacterized protein n=1 Tax=Pleurotus ostreatus TaxID=5322 RepID=A0A8H6ZLI0_PLEOS|nr:uncharacterized protein PC9H_009320 [Pleurotus ostreatus]KAF7424020.1 hypothetical protein PC9H_009320 [Pleurotus ostreatus]